MVVTMLNVLLRILLRVVEDLSFSNIFCARGSGYPLTQQKMLSEEGIDRGSE